MMTHDEIIAVIQAHKNGAKIEARMIGGCDSWLPSVPSWSFCDFDYRVKPSPAMRPWTADEVPLGAYLKLKADDNTLRAMILAVSDMGVSYCGGDGYRFANLETMLEKVLHSTDNGKTWLPCGKEIV